MEDDAHQPGSAEGASNLQQLADEDASLFALIRVLLSFATLPHVILILVLSVLLQLAAVNGMESTSAFGFLSLWRLSPDRTSGKFCHRATVDSTARENHEGRR